MENGHKVYGHMQKKSQFFHVGKPPILGPMGALKISKGGPLQNQNFDVVKLQIKLFQWIWLILTLKKMV